MRDFVVEKASPIGFLIVVVWYLDAPHHLVSGFFYEVCMNTSAAFAVLGNFFR